MNLLSLFIIRNRYRRAVVMPRIGIAHSEPSNVFSNSFSLPFATFFFLLPFVLSYFIPNFSRADQILYSVSTQSNALDNGNETARAAALGSAFTCVTDDASALFSNPAGLGFLNQSQLFLNTDFWLVGTFQETALAGFPAGGLGGFAFAAHYLDYGQMDGRDELGNVTANYGADQLGLQAGWGWEALKDFSVGAGVHGLQTTLSGVGYTGLTSSFGALWKENGWGVGASWLNAGWIFSGGTTESALNLGVSHEIALDSTSRFLTALGGSFEPNAINYLQAGVEYSLQGRLFLRAGCQVPLSDNDLGGLTDVTAGVGFFISGFRLDYAFLPYGDLGAAQRATIAYFFGGPPSDSSTSKTAQNRLVHSIPAGNASGASVSPANLPGLPPLPPIGMSGPIHFGNGSANAGALPQGSSQTTAGVNGMAPALQPPTTNLPGFGMGMPPPSLSAAPASFGNGGGTTSTVSMGSSQATANAHGMASTAQPQAANPSQAKDSLVVQFDLPDNSTPDGAELEKEGKYREALDAYLAVLRQNPKDIGSWRGLGNCYWRLGQKPYAIQCFQQVLQLQPNNPPLADWLRQNETSGP